MPSVRNTQRKGNIALVALCCLLAGCGATTVPVQQGSHDTAPVSPPPKPLPESTNAPSTNVAVSLDAPTVYGKLQGHWRDAGSMTHTDWYFGSENSGSRLLTQMEYVGEKLVRKIEFPYAAEQFSGSNFVLKQWNPIIKVDMRCSATFTNNNKSLITTKDVRGTPLSSTYERIDDATSP